MRAKMGYNFFFPFIFETTTESAVTNYDPHYGSELTLLPIRTTVVKVHDIELSTESNFS